MPTVSINMLVTSILDGAATCTHSKTHNPTDTTPPTDAKTTSNTDKVTAPPPLTEDQEDTLQQMQKTDPFCWLLNRKVPSHDINTFMLIKDLLYKHVVDSNKKFFVLVIHKSWCFMVLVEAHDKLGHQGVNRTYHLVKWQYY